MRQQYIEKLKEVAKNLELSYQDGLGVNPDSGDNLPSRNEVIKLTKDLLELLFPGYENQTKSRITASMITNIHHELSSQICRSVRFFSKCKNCGNCNDECDDLAFQLLEKVPEIREILKTDVKAAYNGDPAATCFDEIILSYPGLKTIAIQRLAHVLYTMKVPLLPRFMTEYAHHQTGIDIHPGAKLGKGVFIDHGTGVVIGETAEIGDNVSIYQGVTLGAANFPKDACGMLIKGCKRHPTIGNNVTIYSGASVLGDIVIGDNCVIGGNVWLTESLPAGTKITASPPANNLRFAKPKR